MFSRLILYFTIATVPILFGAVQPWVWSFYTALIFLAFLITVWQAEQLDLKGGKILLPTVGVFFVFTLIQSISLPSPISSLLFSLSWPQYAQSAKLTGAAQPWQSLGYLPSPSLAWWAFLLGLLLLATVFNRSFTDKKQLRLFIWIILIVALLEATYGIIQALVPKLGVLWVQRGYGGNARGTYINRNHFAGFIEMVWPLALGFSMAYAARRDKKAKFKDLIGSDRTGKQILLVLLIVVLLLALLFSASRAGIMGGFLGFLSFIALSRSKDKKYPVGFWVMSGGIFLLLLVYGMKIGFDPIIDRFLRLDADNSRIDFWRDGLVILKDHPFGIGLGNFKHVFPVYFASNVADIKVSHIHNDYLQFLIEGGWPAFIALMTGFGVFLVGSIRRVKRMRPHRDPLRFYLAVGALSGIISIAFHSFFDFNLQIPANCVYFVMLISIVYTCTQGKDWLATDTHRRMRDD